MVRRTMILLLGLVFVLMGFSAWADDDAIIDIDNHIAAFTGTWGTNNTPILFYGDDFRWAACSGSDTSGGTITAEATFSSANAGIYVDITGQYAVYVRWVAHPNRTDSARYRVFDGTTQVGSCTHNQMSRGGEWVYCTTVNLTSGNAAVVKLGNNCETGKYVVADAVRFVRVSKDANDLIDEAGADYTDGDQNTLLSSTDTIIRSVTITAPSSGKVIVIASGYFYIYDGTGNGGRCSITTENTLDYSHLIIAGPESGYTTQRIYIPFSGVRGFSVSSGSNTFNLVCNKYGTASVYIGDTNLDAIFVSTTY